MRRRSARAKNASDQEHAETENKFANQKRGRGKFAQIDCEESCENLREWFFDDEDADFDSESEKKKSPAGSQAIWSDKD